MSQAGLFELSEDTALVLGNGPSLRGVDLPALPGMTFGMNAAYRYWRQIDWRPNCYSCLDLVVGLSHAEEIARLIEEDRIQHFLLRANLIEALGTVGQSPRVICYEALASQDARLAPKTITTGSHTALWALTMGFTKVALLGIDGKYKEFVDGAQPRGGMELEIAAQADNPNYFFEGYQQTGDRYNIPNPRPGLHVEGWAQAAAVLKEHDVEVVNTNPQSDVQFFPFIELERALNEGSPKAAATVPIPAYEHPRKSGTSTVPEGQKNKLGRLLLERRLLFPFAGLLAIATCLAVFSSAGPMLTSAVLLLILAVAAAFGVFLLHRRAVIDTLAAQDTALMGLEARIKALESNRLNSH